MAQFLLRDFIPLRFLVLNVCPDIPLYSHRVVDSVKPLNSPAPAILFKLFRSSRLTALAKPLRWHRSIPTLHIFAATWQGPNRADKDFSILSSRKSTLALTMMNGTYSNNRTPRTPHSTPRDNNPIRINCFCWSIGHARGFALRIVAESPVTHQIGANGMLSLNMWPLMMFDLFVFKFRDSNTAVRWLRNLQLL